MSMRAFGLAVAVIVASAPALAQESATGIGVGVSSSRSDSSSIAISGQGGRGGNARSNAFGGNAASTANNGITVNTGQPANTTSRSEQIVSGGTANVQRSTGGLRNVPSTFAPSLAAAGLETCLGSVSGGGSGMGFGISFGTTIVDKGCDARLDARTLWGMGLKRASLARLCLKPEIQQSLPECAEYLPQPAQAGYGPGPVAVAPARLEPAEYSGGRVMVIEKRTGRERPCDNYANGRCLRWGG
jgi:hypothetical protein